MYLVCSDRKSECSYAYTVFSFCSAILHAYKLCTAVMTRNRNFTVKNTFTKDKCIFYYHSITADVHCSFFHTNTIRVSWSLPSDPVLADCPVISRSFHGNFLCCLDALTDTTTLIIQQTIHQLAQGRDLPSLHNTSTQCTTQLCIFWSCSHFDHRHTCMCGNCNGYWTLAILQYLCTVQYRRTYPLTNLKRIWQQFI